jgi:hypothetical protein
MFGWFSSSTSKEIEDKCAPNPDDVERDLKDLLLDGLRETAEETAKDLFSEKPDNGVVDTFNLIDNIGGFFGNSLNNVIDYFNDSVEKERTCRKEEEAAKEPAMPEEYVSKPEPEMPEPEPAPRPAPITPQFFYSQGQWVGPMGVIQDHYDQSNCGPMPGSGNSNGGGGNDNGVDSGRSGPTGCHTDDSGQCKPDTTYDLGF